MNINAWLLLALMLIIMNSSQACVTLYSGYEACPSSSQWPTMHDSSAVSTVFTLGSNSLEIYVWREDGYVWAELIPLTGTPFFGGTSSASFTQNGNHIPAEVMRSPDQIQLGYIVEPTVVLITPLHLPNLTQLNIQEDFILDGGILYVLDSLNVPASADAGSSSGSVVDCSVVPYYDNGIVYIPCARVPDGAGGMSIFRTSWTIIPNRQPLSLELHSLEVFAAE
jgi:hypothetical protein